MRIHTNTVKYFDLRTALNGSTRGVWFDTLTEYGSRSHKRAFNVILESDGTPDQKGTPRRRKRNAGTAAWRAGEVGFAASYDDWGYFLAALFKEDPSAVAGSYKGAADFHAQTKERYRG